MLTVELSMFDLIFTIALVALVLMFVTLLLKIRSSTDKKKDEEEIVQEVSGAGIRPDLQSGAHETFSDLHKGLESNSPKSREIHPWQNRQISKDAVSYKPSEERPRIVVSATAGGASEVEKEPETPSVAKPVDVTRDSVEKECPHKFGYLKSLQRNGPIPDECFGCPKIVECLANKKES